MIPPVICKKDAMYLPDLSGSCGVGCLEKISSADYVIQEGDTSSAIVQLDEFTLSTTADFLEDHFYIFDIQRKDKIIVGDAYFGSRNFTQIPQPLKYLNPTFAGLSFTRQTGKMLVYPIHFWLEDMESGVGIFPTALPLYTGQSGEIEIPIQILKKYELPYTVNWAGEYTLTVYAVQAPTITEDAGTAQVIVTNNSLISNMFAYVDLDNGNTITETLGPGDSITIERPINSWYGVPDCHITPTLTGAITFDNNNDEGVINGDGTITFNS